MVHVGPVGTGLLAKLLNNALFTAHIGLANETNAIAAKLGLDLDALHGVISNGSGASFGFTMSRHQSPTSQARPRSRPSLLRKDVDLLTRAAHLPANPELLLWHRLRAGSRSTHH